MDRPAVVLPQPDSPTSPRVSPLLVVNEMSSTAFTHSLVRWNNPLRTGKYFTRFSTSIKGLAVVMLRPVEVLDPVMIAP